MTPRLVLSFALLLSLPSPPTWAQSLSQSGWQQDPFNYSTNPTLPMAQGKPQGFNTLTPTLPPPIESTPNPYDIPKKNLIKPQLPTVIIQKPVIIYQNTPTPYTNPYVSIPLNQTPDADPTISFNNAPTNPSNPSPLAAFTFSSAASFAASPLAQNPAFSWSSGLVYYQRQDVYSLFEQMYAQLDLINQANLLFKRQNAHWPASFEQLISQQRLGRLDNFYNLFGAYTVGANGSFKVALLDASLCPFYHAYWRKNSVYKTSRPQTGCLIDPVSGPYIFFSPSALELKDVQ